MLQHAQHHETARISHGQSRSRQRDPIYATRATRKNFTGQRHIMIHDSEIVLTWHRQGEGIQTRRETRGEESRKVAVSIDNSRLHLPKVRLTYKYSCVRASP